MRPWLALAAALAIPYPAVAAQYGRVYLVPALKQCPTAATCPREFESSFTFDSIVLRSPATRYLPAGKPALFLEVHGVRDAAGTLANGTLVVRVLSGRVSVPGIGTFPDDSSLVQQAPIAIPLKNGGGKVAYKPSVSPPAGTLVNGGGVEVFDPDGKLLAVTGSQSKP
jgi:hypothetical protein